MTRRSLLAVLAALPFVRRWIPVATAAPDPAAWTLDDLQYGADDLDRLHNERVIGMICHPADRRAVLGKLSDRFIDGTGPHRTTIRLDTASGELYVGDLYLRMDTGLPLGVFVFEAIDDARVVYRYRYHAARRVFDLRSLQSGRVEPPIRFESLDREAS